jgi:hypothetical protein
VADRTDYRGYEDARADILAGYDRLRKAGDDVQALIDATGPVRPWFVWATAYRILTNLATAFVVRLSNDDWEFPRLAANDIANWSAIRNHYRMAVDLVDWMERLGSDEASRSQLRTAGAADALRADVDRAVNDRLARLGDPAFWSNLEATQPAQPNGMRPAVTPIPLPGYGLHVPTLPNAARNRDGSPWAGLTGDSYKTALPGQLNAAQFMADLANDAVTMLRTTRGSYNDLFASLKSWMWSAVAVVTALLLGLRRYWAAIAASLAVFVAVITATGGAATPAAVAWARGVTIALAALAAISLDRIMGISQSWVAINKNLDTLAAAVDSFGQVLNEKLTSPIGFVNGRWPDPTQTAEFPNMGRTPTGAWTPVTNSFFDRGSSTAPPDPRAPR